MCKRHMHEVMRAAVLDALMPWDVVRELVSLTSDMMAMRRLMDRTEDEERAAQREALRRLGIDENKRKLGVVYYLSLPGNRIKIGRTINLKQRMSSLRVSAEDVLAAEPGGSALESTRHGEFGHVRHGRREDFDATPELMEHVEQVRQKWGDPWSLGAA